MLLSALQHGVHGIQSLVLDHGESTVAQSIDVNKIAKAVLDLQQADGTFVGVEGTQDEGTVRVLTTYCSDSCGVSAVIVLMGPQQFSHDAYILMRACVVCYDLSHDFFEKKMS